MNRFLQKNIDKDDFSERIALLRFPLIVLIVAIHARYRSFALVPGKSLFNADIFCVFPHTVVPFFFLISGFFLVWKLNYGSYFDYKKLLQKKFVSLFVPYISWNTLLFFLHWITPKLFPNSALFPPAKYANLSVGAAIVKTYGLDLNTCPIDVPLWFVRSLMILFLISPALLWLIYHVKGWILAGMMVVALFFGKIDIVSYFLLGMLIGLFHWDLSSVDHFCWLLWAGVVVLGLIPCFTAVWPVFVLLSIAALYSLAGWIRKMPLSFQRIDRCLGENTFFIFCVHAPIATTLTRLAIKFSYFGISPVLCYVLVIVMTVIISFTFLCILKRGSPFLCSMLTGNRCQMIR